MWKNEKLTLSPKEIFRQINYIFCDLFGRTTTFTKFLPKSREREFPKFCVWKLILTFFWQTFRENSFSVKSKEENSFYDFRQIDGKTKAKHNFAALSLCKNQSI